MGDIVQVLIVIGIIVFAIVKQLNKSSEEAKKQQQPQRSWPREDEEMEEMEFERPISEPFLSYDFDHHTPSPKPQDSPPAPEEPAENQEFNIQSTEEVRRAIIWSEILNRKY